DFSKDIITWEAKTSQEATNLAICCAGRQALHVLKWRRRQVQPFKLMLSEIADGQMFTGYPGTCQQWQRPGKRLDQGRLARAIGAKQANALPRQEGKTNLLKLNTLVIGSAITESGFVQHQQRMRRLFGRGQGEMEGRIHMGQRDGAHALEHLQSTLGLTGLGGLVAKACHELLDFLASCLLLGGNRLLQRQLLCASALERRVIATIQH